ncbi:MAG TPA: phosphoribosylglycinamide synthetase C domain-containing protein, partial [Gammaproteobacteria bacterium]|nr:phosphoribosylglycinamide synthetase C domain-containing protein [Gammaproteobacteria bacterium]
IQALMKEVGERYQGILYGGFMATKDGVRLIEFNARFGDPEALNLLAILESDFLEICQAIVIGKLKPELVKFAPLATVCKYAVPEGYPDHPLKNLVVDLSRIKKPEQLYIAGLQIVDNKLFTTGSRAVAVVGKAKSIPQAEKIAEEAIKHIQGRLYHREDIGKNDLIQACVRQMQALRHTTTTVRESEG